MLKAARRGEEWDRRIRTTFFSVCPGSAGNGNSGIRRRVEEAGITVADIELM